MRNYRFEYSHREIVGVRVVKAIDSYAAFKIVRGYLNTRFGNGNWVLYNCRYHSKAKDALRADGKPTIQRVWSEPPRLKTANYAAMEKYGAWQYKN